MYATEVQEFVGTGWSKAITDLYPDKLPEARVVGFKHAILRLGVQDYIRVKYNRNTNEITLERY
jgi:hypothetical protein